MSINFNTKLLQHLPKIKESEIAVFCFNKADFNSLLSLKSAHIIYVNQKDDSISLESFYDSCAHKMTFNIDSVRKFLRSFKLIIIVKDKSNRRKFLDLFEKERVEYLTIDTSSDYLKRSVQILAEIATQGNLPNYLTKKVLGFSSIKQADAQDYDHVSIIVGPEALAKSFLTISKQISDSKISTSIHLDNSLNAEVNLFGIVLIEKIKESMLVREASSAFEYCTNRVPIFLLFDE